MIITRGRTSNLSTYIIARRLTIRRRVLGNVHQTRYQVYTPYSCFSINDIFILMFYTTHDTQCRTIWVTCYVYYSHNCVTSVIQPYIFLL